MIGLVPKLIEPRSKSNQIVIEIRPIMIAVKPDSDHDFYGIVIKIWPILQPKSDPRRPCQVVHEYFTVHARASTVTRSNKHSVSPDPGFRPWANLNLIAIRSDFKSNYIVVKFWPNYDQNLTTLWLPTPRPLATAIRPNFNWNPTAVRSKDHRRRPLGFRRPLGCNSYHSDDASDGATQAAMHRSERSRRAIERLWWVMHDRALIRCARDQSFLSLSIYIILLSILFSKSYTTIIIILKYFWTNLSYFNKIDKEYFNVKVFYVYCFCTS